MLLRAIARSGRTLRSSTSRQCLRLSQQTGRRGYSSAKDTVKKAGSEVPWAISAIALTIGGTYVALLPRSAPHDEHHDDHGEEHEDHEEKEEEAPAEEDPVEEKSEEPSKEEDKSEDKPEESGEEKAASSDDEKKEEKSESKDDSEGKPTSSSSSSDEVSHKGPTKAHKEDIKKHEEGSMGKKLRLDSPAGKTIGEGSSSGEGDAFSKKQGGMSNTDTRHSTDPAKDPEKSKKGEGTVETAKIKGTVDPSRPQGKNE